MPEFITEDQYIAVEGLINNPPPNTTDFHLTAWKKHQNSYKDQQFRAGIPDLTPRKNLQQAENNYNNRKKFADIYSKSPMDYDVSSESNAEYLTTPEARARRINRNYLSTIYSNDKIDSTNHDLYRTDFAKRFLNSEDILTDEQFYDAVKPYVQEQFQQEETENKVQSQAVVNYYKGLPVSESLKQLRTLGTPNEAKIIELHKNIDAVIAPVRPYIDRALNALERQTKPADRRQEGTVSPVKIFSKFGGSKEPLEAASRRLEEIAADKAQDEKAINDLRDILIKTHPSNRAKIMKKIMGEAELRGQATVNDVRNLLNEAVDSAKNIFQGFDAFEDMGKEVDMSKMRFNAGEEVWSTTVPEIKTPEQAQRYLVSKIVGNEIAPAIGPGAAPVVPNINRFTLDDNSVKLLRDAKAELTAAIEFNRDVRGLEKAVDPFREGWQTTMATTVGSSVGIMGVYALASRGGPLGLAAGITFTGSLYTGLNYDEIRSRYPDLSPDKARNVALTSGGIEALLDLGQYKIITSAFKTLGVKQAIDLTARSAANRFTRRAVGTAAKTYIFELGIELLQEGTRPVVQSIMAEFDREYSINTSEEWKSWTEAVPHIMIGMAPLAIIGGLGAGSKTIFADRAFKDSVMQEGSLKAFGLSDEQAVEIQQLVNNNMYDAARNRIKELNNDPSVISNRQTALETIVANNGIDQIRAFEEARLDGIIPRYTVDEATGEYVIEDGTRFADQKSYLENVRARVIESEQAYNEEIADRINNPDAEVESVDIDELRTKTNLLGRLKGFSQEELTTFDNIFGSTEVEQNDVYEQLIINIAEKGNLEGIKSYIDGVYNNIPQNVRDALGKDKAEGVETLFKLVTGQSAAVKNEGDLTGSTIVIQDAIHDVNFVDTPLELDNQFTELRYSDIRKNQAKSKNVKANTIEAVAISDIQQTPGGNYVKSVVDFLQSNYDVRISFVKGQEVNGEYLGPIGYSEGRDIIIDIDRAKGSLLNHVIGHEFAHFLENFEDVYSEVSNAIISTVDKTTLNRYMEMFKAEGEIIARKELVSDTFGQRFRDINFWESVTTEMYQQNPSKADNFIGIVKEYLGEIKSALLKSALSGGLANREINNSNFTDIDKMNSAIVGAMLKARSRPADGTTGAQFMEAIPNPENRSVDYVARKLRDQINAAMSQIKEAEGQILFGRKRLIESLIEPQNEAQYNSILNYREGSIRRNLQNERRAGKNIGKTLRSISNRLYKALQDNNITAKLLAEAEAANIVINPSKRGSKLTFNEVESIKNNPAEKVMEYIREFTEGRKEYISKFIKDVERVYDEVLKQPEVISDPIVNSFFTDVKAALFESDVVKIRSELSEVYNQLYTGEGIPREMDADTFERLTTKYSVYKAFGAWERRNVDEQEQVIEQAFAWSRSVLEGDVKVGNIFVNAKSEELINSSIQEVATNPNTIERKTGKRIPLLDGLFSYLDNHITFASELELLSPSIGTPGKPITANLQKVSDMLTDAYLNIQDEQIDIQDSVLNKVEKIFNINTKEAVKKIYELLTKEVIKVNINGKEVKLKEGYAGYILNVDEQLIYREQLNGAGFTDEVLQEIRSQISPKVNELRIKLRDDLIKIIKRNNAKIRKDGDPAIDPSELFYPVQKSSLLRSVIDNFDIAYGAGIQPEVVQNELRDENELDLDLEEQNINIISMFNTHAYQTTHKANLAEPINILKRIFNSQSVREKLNEKIGTDGVKTIFRCINALESGGITSTEFGRPQKALINQILSGTARAMLGFNLKTYFVNAMSSTNILLDTSIPTFIKIKAFMGAISGAFTVDGKSAVDKVIQRRFKAGANTLLQVVKGSSENVAPNILKDISDGSLQAIGNIDAYFLTFSGIAAYNAHYEIGKKQGLQGEALHNFAEKGMVRTIAKVSQPNMAATKSYLEQTSNPYLRTISIFMSETRKNFGLEWTALRKGGLSPGQYLDILIMNHLVLGSAAYALRATAGTVLGEEDPWDLESWMMYVLSGPLSGIILFGSAADGLVKQIYNQFAEKMGMEKVRVFPSSSAPVRVVSDILKVKNIVDPDKTISEKAEALATSLEGGGAIVNQPAISSAGTILEAATDIYKALFERE
jgi:hypothetical protein